MQMMVDATELITNRCIFHRQSTCGWLLWRHRQPNNGWKWPD